MTIVKHTGIPHLHSLHHNDFIRVVRKLPDHTVTEKLDGANLVFGFTLDGRFYTSRESKNGQRFFNSNDYENVAANNGFRSAHKVLDEQQHLLRKVVGEGNAIEVEILYGPQPNAIKYGKNYIVFLRAVQGDTDGVPDQAAINNLTGIFCGTAVTVNIVRVVIPENCLRIEAPQVETGTDTWVFATASRVTSPLFQELSGHDLVHRYESWLNENNEILDLPNKHILELSLSKVPQASRFVKQQVMEMSQFYKNAISNTIINFILRKSKPELQTLTVAENEVFGIEGIVFLNPETLEQFKVVDVENFTIANQFFHSVRNQIKNTFNRTNTFGVCIVDSGDIYGNMLKDVADIIGIPELGNYMKIKAYFKTILGSSKQETITNVINAIPKGQTTDIHGRVVDAIATHRRNLHHAHTRYMRDWKSFSYALPSGQIIKYNQYIHERNLMIFAEVDQQIRNMLISIQEHDGRADTVGNLIEVLYEKQLKDLHDA